MKFRQLTLILVAAFAFVGVSFAQQSKTDESVEFRPHWSLQVQGGAAYTLGETNFGDLISPAVYLNAGYKFHHGLGVRFGIGGWQAKGYVVLPQQGYSYNFLQGNIDFVVDLSSLIGGYNHRRVASVFAFAGLGLNGGINNKQAVAIQEANPREFDYLWNPTKFFVAGRLGLGVDFRCSDLISVNLEANTNFLSDHFNSKKAENLDWHFNLLAGVTFRFGKNYRPSKVYAEKVAAEKAAAEAAAKAAAEKAAAEKAAAEAAAKAAAEKAAAEAAAAKAAAEQAERERAAAERAQLIAENSQNVFFQIGKSYISREEGKKIDTLAEWLKANPSYSVEVVGYADKETGYTALNKKLSERRAANVKARLLAAGIAEERIVTDHKGDTVQPFGEKSAKNRVVICTLE